MIQWMLAATASSASLTDVELDHLLDISPTACWPFAVSASADRLSPEQWTRLFAAGSNASAALQCLTKPGAPVADMVAALPRPMVSEVARELRWKAAALSPSTRHSICDALLAQDGAEALFVLVSLDGEPAPARARWCERALRKSRSGSGVRHSFLTHLEPRAAAALCAPRAGLSFEALSFLLGAGDDDAFEVVLRSWCRRRDSADGLAADLARHAPDRLGDEIVGPLVVNALAGRLRKAELARLGDELDAALNQVAGAAAVRARVTTSLEEAHALLRDSAADDLSPLTGALFANPCLLPEAYTVILDTLDPPALRRALGRRLPPEQSAPALARLFAGENEAMAEAVLELTSDAARCMDLLVASAADSIGALGWAVVLDAHDPGGHRAASCPYPVARDLYSWGEDRAGGTIGAYLLGRLGHLPGWMELTEQLGKDFSGTVGELADVVEALYERRGDRSEAGDLDDAGRARVCVAGADAAR